MHVTDTNIALWTIITTPLIPIAVFIYQGKEWQQSGAERDVSVGNFKQAVTRAIDGEDIAEVVDVVAVAVVANAAVVVVVAKGQAGAGAPVAAAAATFPQLQILRHGLIIV